MNREVIIGHLYPREMNIYGDMGNIITLVRRLEWRGYRPIVRSVEIGAEVDFSEFDIIFGGGGQDSGQLVVGEDLQRHGDSLRAMAADGMPMLLICGLYQLFGREFLTSESGKIPGIDVFHATTKAGNVRMIGNIVMDSRFGRLVGFENHSGQTYLDEGQDSLGTVVKGSGNAPKSGIEGAITNWAIGTYLHGPLLPKNPMLADALLGEAIRRKFGDAQLAPLDDELAQKASVLAQQRPI